MLGRHWFWLLLPVAVSILGETKARRLFLLSLSSGLTLNLVYCVMQMYGYVEVTTGGSNAEDATGHIGHIGFGLVYGIWAAWLLHLGLIREGRLRLIFWGLAAWSYVMVFSAQGRSGYLIAIALMLCVLYKWVFDLKSWKVIIPVSVGCLIVVLAIGIGPGKERLQGTWQALTQKHELKSASSLDNTDYAFLATLERFYMWKTSIEIWQKQPLLGVGTGGLPHAVSDLKSGFRLTENITVAESFAHPHNQYILNLTRWGPAGVILLLALLSVWMREGFKVDWQHSVVAPLSTLSGLALALHALSSSSMEEHFSAILAVLLLATAMSVSSENSRSTGGSDEI
ncbi:O-antigen ligase family protein [Mariprofundus micogutta]|uniref:O-antigen ligase family protein n=1 Tax=Mariprofundus micogutta TaxID=1921010 RepID=UPI001D0FAD70|nr:O-antigen ligase family protein [Mariprofundus micogutta]